MDTKTARLASNIKNYDLIIKFTITYSGCDADLLNHTRIASVWVYKKTDISPSRIV